MSDIDIDSMDPNSAREYVLSFITTLKRTQKERSILQEEHNLWEKRVELAGHRDELQLRKAAEERAQELKIRIASLLEEENSLRRKVSILKEKIKAIQVRLPLSVDAEELLAQLQMAAGEEDSLEKRFKEEEAEQALKELKKKLQDEGR